ncbi:hypothetical protein MKX83_17320 [Cytobacillus sp. FSL M8-0252]|uniref:hypothetical protein n=1 Tax=Cytobacillus sp. FSL M8-0252 TaxID=2921621 RepID=UPI0030FA5D1B
MSKYEKMTKSLERMQEIRGGITQTVLDYSKLVEEQTMPIENDVDLSPTGRIKKVTEAKKALGEGFMDFARKLKDDYQKESISAKVAAEDILNQVPKAPSDSSLKTFERILASLKLDIKLGRSDSISLGKLKSFVATIDQPYFAQRIVDDYGDIIGLFDGLAEIKPELSLLLESLRDKAKTDEQKHAEQVLQTIDNEYSRDLFTRGLVMDTLHDTFGHEVADYANQPHLHKGDDA